MREIRVALVGLGDQGRKDHLQAILENRGVRLSGVCDVRPDVVHRISSETGAPGFMSVESLVAAVNPHVAVVAVPHDVHFSTAQFLLERGISVLKEKPLALTTEQGVQLVATAARSKALFMISAQRRFHPVYRTFRRMLSQIGETYLIEARYAKNIARLDEGWRAQQSRAGGGALIDMGYHFVDLLVWYFGLPSSVRALMSSGNRVGQVYDVEDTALLNLSYPRAGSESRGGIIASLFVSRAYPTSEERLTAVGTSGLLELTRKSVKLVDHVRGEMEVVSSDEGWEQSFARQFDHFVEAVRAGEQSVSFGAYEHLKHAQLIASAYESARRGDSVAIDRVLSADGGLRYAA